MKKSISVLILCNYMFTPPISGGIKRMFAPILNMGGDAGIDFSLMYMSYTPEEIQHHHNYLKQVKRLKHFHGTLTSRSFQLDSGITPPDFPKQVWYTMNRDFLDDILDEVSSREYDIIQVTHPQLAWIVPKLRLATDARVIMDCQNLEWLVFKRWMDYAKPEHWKWVETDYKQLKKWEEKVLDWFDGIFCISPIEKSILEGIVKKAKILYVPTGAGVNDEEYIPKDKNRDKPFDLVFIGSMDWFPTTDALMWLINEVMPIVWKKRPKTKLEVIGSGEPDHELVRLFRTNRRVTFWGPLENEIPILHQSKIFVSPIRIGAGVRLKNPTAWVAHLPVVATSLSVEGLEYTSGKDVLIGDTPEDFAHHVLALLENPRLMDLLVENAYESYVRNYSNEKLMGIWKNAYYEIADGK